ncbi:HPP family protein [Marimonas lutisalis]|uniref:HPP family protein n=1 Tax=Marimonas lutisalis TaxID=2545756 RepID=UPI001F287076|nr:HPP family protein [Marimonas lutisalis]
MNSHKERIIAGIGGGLAILVVFTLTLQAELSVQGDIVLIASMGASAVLLFAAPHSLLSQPWNVIGGHLVSALIGVVVHRLVADTALASGLAVGLAIIAMHYLRCLHPPGGATSLIPIILGPAGESYGLILVLFPIGTSALAMILLAMLFNLPFGWRRYPLPLRPKTTKTTGQVASYPDISHADFVAALAEIDTFVDISEEDLLRIYRYATRRR